MKILNFGSLNIDYVYRLDHIVKKGETISSESLNVYSGGKGLNQSVALAKAGAEYISPHAETINTDAFRVMNLIESLGCKKGVVLNPATPLSYIKHYLNRIDMLTIMTVDVGFAGQPFIAEMLDKIREAAELREKYGYSYKIQIDGSCNVNTFKRLREAGADVFVVGSSGLFKNDPDLNKACDIMYENFEKETGEAVYR